ncbi:DNA replication complex GINS protein PSF1-like isoform X2 [Centruroides vittatus]|uniref:DNA replication complex GINS protein PSF1-like isoform X2 n=1 Tax=Centruroides vittatus TaxID=120091 RepID=UPI00350F8C86
MLADKAMELIKELHRCKDTLQPLKEDVMQQVMEEMKALFEENQKDVAESVNEDVQLHTSIQFRHSVLLRNKRCLYNRLEQIRDMRWAFGSALPSDISQSLSESEMEWFQNYSRIVATYMSTIGGGIGTDLFENLQPPKSLFIQVRCLCDYGDFETDDGTIIVLTKNSTHLMQRSQCEKLIHQGILEHITM